MNEPRVLVRAGRRLFPNQAPVREGRDARLAPSPAER